MFGKTLSLSNPEKPFFEKVGNGFRLLLRESMESVLSTSSCDACVRYDGSKCVGKAWCVSKFDACVPPSPPLANEPAKNALYLLPPPPFQKAAATCRKHTHKEAKLSAHVTTIFFPPPLFSAYMIVRHENILCKMTPLFAVYVYVRVGAWKLDALVHPFRAGEISVSRSRMYTRALL